MSLSQHTVEEGFMSGSDRWMYEKGAGGRKITNEMLYKWRAYSCTIPLEDVEVPVGGAPLASVSDEALLACPPHVIAHIQRTSAQGGKQIISPRQTPFSSLMVRRGGTENLLGDHNVGSTAEPHSEWPTLDNFDSRRLLPDEPIAPIKSEHPIREKTRSIALVKGGHEMADPVMACLVKGRAIIDILRRPDVAGGADEMAEVLASAWGIEVDDLLELEAYTLGLEGSLQRHAIRTDEVYPTLYAPVQYTSVITCGTSDLDKRVLPPYTAMDWRRARVFCEAVFYGACQLEGLPIRYMRGMSHPEDKGGGANKPMTLTFYPAPGQAWSYHPATFSLHPIPSKQVKAGFVIPRPVREALQRYINRVRPVSYMLSEGHTVGTSQSVARDVEQLSGETLATGYARALRSVTTGAVRGRNASAAVRNALYEAIATAPLDMALRISHSMNIAGEACYTYLGSTNVPDVVIAELARRFVDIGSHFRAKIAREAERRGESIETWWSDIVSQAPARYQTAEEGSHSWAKVGLWLSFREPTEKWGKLRDAISFKTMRRVEKDAVGGEALPAEKGSAARLRAAVQAYVAGITKAYSGYYLGAADVGMAVAKAADELHRSRLAAVIREASYLWALRARAFRGINVHLIAKEDPTPSSRHLRVEAEPLDVLLKPQPYQAYKAWRKHMSNSDIIPKFVKKHFAEGRFDKISDAFATHTRAMLHIPPTKLSRYINSPSRLGADMEKAWAELVGDVKEVIVRFCAETEPKQEVAVEVVPESTDYGEMIADALRPAAERPDMSYWDALVLLPQDDSAGIMDRVDEMPEELSEMLMEMRFTSLDHFLSEVESMKAIADAPTAPSGEAVR